MDIANYVGGVGEILMGRAGLVQGAFISLEERAAIRLASEGVFKNTGHAQTVAPQRVIKKQRGKRRP
ncbi:cytochrome c family protein [Pseudomonas sp. StFLB209]|nr:cytochrome c family protein [Pseudomonas sp. StFLB209]